MISFAFLHRMVEEIPIILCTKAIKQPSTEGKKPCKFAVIYHVDSLNVHEYQVVYTLFATKMANFIATGVKCSTKSHIALKSN